MVKRRLDLTFDDVEVVSANDVLSLPRAMSRKRWAEQNGLFEVPPVSADVVSTRRIIQRAILDFILGVSSLASFTSWRSFILRVSFPGNSPTSTVLERVRQGGQEESVVESPHEFSFP
jgi:hypothetical protein